MKRKWVAVAAMGALVMACGEEPVGDPRPPGTQNPPGTGTQDPTYSTPEQLLSAAPPVWSPQGVSAGFGGVSFLRPADWETTVYTDGVAVRSPPDANGERCEVLVLQPRPTPADTEAKYQHVLDVTTALFPEGTVIGGEFGSTTPLDDRWRGRTGRGWDYDGLILEADGYIYVLSFLAEFGGTSVPVVMIQSNQSTWGCVNILGEFGVGPATVFHSLALEGFTPSSADLGHLADAALGEWFSSDGSVGNFLVFGANGHYVDAAVYGGTVYTSPGDWHSEYATWAGDGRYAIRGDALGLFPSNGAAAGHYVRQYEELSSDGTWQRKLCMINTYDSEPYTICYHWRG